MKKLAKPLVLFLVIALLAGAFVFNVMADSEPESTVGQYTETSATAWKPAEGSGITYAVWASEDDYKNGETPTATSTSNEITGAMVGVTNKGDLTVKSNYVHMFADCTTESIQLWIGQNQTIVMNLAGHVLTIRNGILLGCNSGAVTNAKMTLKNGSIVHTAGNIQCRGNSELRYDNIVFNGTSACLNYDDNAALIEFKDSILNVSGTARFALATNSGRTPCKISFINSDVVTVNATSALFQINAHDKLTREQVEIRFDKDSSITRDSAVPLVAMNRGFVDASNPDTVKYVKAPQLLIFEEGCEISSAIAPVEGKGYSYQVMHYNQSSGKYGPHQGAANLDSIYTTNFDGGFSDGQLAVRVVKPGTNEMISYKGEAASNGCVKLVANAPEGVWIPTSEYAGIAYGLWASEADYLAGKKPAAWSTNGADVSNSNVGMNATIVVDDKTVTPGYMRCYADISFDIEQLQTGDKQDLTIDLAGWSLHDNKGLRPGGASGSHPNSYVTIRNGVYYRNGGQFQIRQDTKVTFDRVAYIHNAGTQEITYGGSGDILKFIDSTIINHTGLGFHMGSPYINQGMAVSEVMFINSDIVYATAPTAPLFNINESAWGDCVYQFVFDKNSSIFGDFTTEGWFQLSEGYASETPQANFDVDVIIEEGFVYYAKATPTFKATYRPATSATTFGDTIILDASAEEGSKFNWYVTKPGDYANASTYTAKALSTGYYNAHSLVMIDERAFFDYLSKYYQYIELNAAGEVTKTYPLGSVIGTGNKSVAFSFTNGTTVMLLHDTLINEGGTQDDYSVTFDLNGFTLQRIGSNHIQLGHSMSGQWKDARVIKFINTNPDKRGVLDFDNTPSPLQNRPGTSVYFQGVDIYVNTLLFNEYGAKYMNFKDVNFISSNGGYIVGSGFDTKTYSDYVAKGGVREFVLDNCTFTNCTFASWTHSVEDNVKVTVKNGCVLDNANNAPFSVVGSGIKNLELDIAADTKFTSYANYVVATGATAEAIVECNLPRGAFMASGELFTASAKPSIPKGKLQANLTLYTDFTLNFFADNTVIGGVIMNGQALEAVDFNGMKKYEVAGISAAAAAESIPFIFVVNQGENVYYVSASYSPTAYAQTVVASNSISTLGKQLTTAAMEYVKAAYTYSGKTAPAFVGVAVTAATAPATEAANLPELIEGAQLSLGENLKLRFTLAEGKSGTLKVGDATYVVENGKVGEVNYVEVDMRAYAFYDADIVVSDGTTTGTYTLAHYVNAVKGNSNAQLVDLVNAFYTYTKYANEYKATGELN